MKDAELVLAHGQGDQHAFPRLLDRYQKPLFTFIMRMVQDRNAAEDLFQETFYRILRHLKKFDPNRSFPSWAFSISHRLCIDHLRRKQREQSVFFMHHAEIDEMSLEAVDPESRTDELAEQREKAELVAKALDRLPATQREMLLLRQHSGLTFREIAELLDMPLNTALSHMRRALSTLQHYVEKEYV